MSNLFNRLTSFSYFNTGPTLDWYLGVVGPYNSKALVAMLRAYVDESYGDEKFILSCAVSTVSKFNQFDRKWKKLLKKNDIESFHAVDFYPRAGAFRGWSSQRSDSFLEKVINLEQRHMKFLLSVSIPMGEFESEYRSREGLSPKERGSLDSVYQLAFRFILIQLIVRYSNNYPNEIEPVNLIVESGGASEEALQGVFGYISDYCIQEDCPLKLNLLSFGGKEVPGLQLADLLANTTFKQESEGPHHRIDGNNAVPFSEAQRITKNRCPHFLYEPSKDHFKDLVTLSSGQVKHEKRKRSHDRWMKKQMTMALK